MARSVYFAFHYDDVASFRANVVRNSSTFSASKFKDSSIWEKTKEKSPTKIKAVIDDALKGVSVTCVLVGSSTYSRRYVRYEIIKSLVEKKGLVAVGINWIKDKTGNTKFWAGENPFEYLKVSISNEGDKLHFFEYADGSWKPYSDMRTCKNVKHFDGTCYGKTFRLDRFFKTYSYGWDSGNKNLASWIEEAANKMGR